VIDYKSDVAGPEGYAALVEECQVSMEIYCEAGGSWWPGRMWRGN